MHIQNKGCWKTGGFLAVGSMLTDPSTFIYLGFIYCCSFSCCSFISFFFSVNRLQNHKSTFVKQFSRCFV